MKVDTHPHYNDAATVTCACGNTFKVGSTKDSIVVEICSNCHPFYTGNEKNVDSAGRVDRFKTRMAKAAPKKTAKKAE